MPDTRLLRVWLHKGILQLILDAITVSSVFLLTYYLQYRWPVIAGDHTHVPDIIPYLEGAALLSLFWVFLIWRDRGYTESLTGQQTILFKMQTVFVSGLYASGLLITLSFMITPLILSRQVYILSASIALGIMYLTRVLFRHIDQELADKGMVAHRVLIAGLNREGAEFAQRLSSKSSLCQVVGFMALDDQEETQKEFEGFPVLGRLRDVKRIYGHFFFDKVLVPNSIKELESDFIDVLNFCESKNISLYTLPNHFHVSVIHEEVISDSGIPMILIRDAAVPRFVYPLVKRSMDMLIAGLVLALGAPVWLAIALAIKLHDGGPVFFFQTRAGLHGHPFRMFKFRSMVVKAEDKLAGLVDMDNLSEPVFKIKNDPRVTPLGRFLRKTGLDEIPQLVNILRGEMSLIGPRPEEVGVVDRYDAWQRRRLKAVPGITGFQQIQNRGEPSLSRRIKYDLVYLKYQSLLLDLYILMKTVKVVVTGKGVTH